MCLLGVVGRRWRNASGAFAGRQNHRRGKHVKQQQFHSLPINNHFSFNLFTHHLRAVRGTYKIRTQDLAWLPLSLALLAILSRVTTTVIFPSFVAMLFWYISSISFYFCLQPTSKYKCGLKLGNHSFWFHVMDNTLNDTSWFYANTKCLNHGLIYT